MRTVHLPRWVAAFLVIATMASLTLTAFAITSFTLYKPFTVTITTAPCPLSIESMSFSYDPSVNRWTSCTLQIKNPTASTVTASVYVYLKNAQGVTVASGQQLGQSFLQGDTTIIVSLTWTGTFTADDVAGGYALIQA